MTAEGPGPDDLHAGAGPPGADDRLRSEGIGRIGGGFIRVGDDGSVDRARPWLHPSASPDDERVEADPSGSDDEDDDGPWVPSPRAGALAALVLVAAAVAGSTFANWRVGEGEAVPCDSFVPNPAVWHRVVGVTPGQAAEASVLEPASWPAVLREAEGSLECAAIVGQPREDVVRALGEPTAAPGTTAGETLGLAPDEQAWVAQRALVVGDDGAEHETVGVAVRFSDGGDGAAVEARRIDQRR